MKRLIVLAVVVAVGMVLLPSWAAAAPPIAFKSQVVTVTAVAGPDSVFDATAICPVGTSVTGGGFNTSNPGNAIFWLVETSAPNGNGWRARGFPTNVQAVGATVLVHAVCGSLG